MGETAVAAGTTPAKPTNDGGTKAKVEVLTFDQRAGVMNNSQVVFAVDEKTKKKHQLSCLGNSGTRQIRQWQRPMQRKPQ